MKRFRKRLSRGRSRRVWKKGKRVHRANKGIISRRNRGGVRF